MKSITILILLLLRTALRTADAACPINCGMGYVYSVDSTNDPKCVSLSIVGSGALFFTFLLFPTTPTFPPYLYMLTTCSPPLFFLSFLAVILIVSCRIHAGRAYSFPGVVPMPRRVINLINAKHVLEAS
jgi:hypothetical protein